MVDLKTLIAKSKDKKNGQPADDPSAIASAEKPKSEEKNTSPVKNGEDKPKMKFNFKKANNSLSTKSESKTANGIKTPKFSFKATTAPGTPHVPVAEKENESVSDNAGEISEGVDDTGSVSLPQSDEIGEIDVTDFVFKEQPENFSRTAIDKLNGALSILKECIDDKQQVGMAITIIMKTLQEHEFLKDIMRAHPEHLGLMVRGLRESYGAVIVKKSANKSKRKAKDTEVSKLSSEMDGLFGDIL